MPQNDKIIMSHIQYCHKTCITALNTFLLHIMHYLHLLTFRAFLFLSFSVSEVPYSNIQDYKIVLNVLQLACVILLFVEKAGFCI